MKTETRQAKGRWKRIWFSNGVHYVRQDEAKVRLSQALEENERLRALVEGFKTTTAHLLAMNADTLEAARVAEAKAVLADEVLTGAYWYSYDDGLDYSCVYCGAGAPVTERIAHHKACPKGNYDALITPAADAAEDIDEVLRPGGELWTQDMDAAEGGKG